MAANVLLYCSRCAQFEKHVRQDNVERCCVCAHENDNHEIPATVDAPNELSRLQIAYCWYMKHLIGTGKLTEWPRGWRDMHPGVWG